MDQGSSGDRNGRGPIVTATALVVSVALMGVGLYAMFARKPIATPPPSALNAITDPPSITTKRNVLLVILDDVGVQEIRSYASDLKTAAAAASVPKAAKGTGIQDTNSNGTPDGVEDSDGDGYADGAIATPKIDSLATAGVRFTQVWSNPLCSPTRAGIYTGLYGRNHGVGSPIGLSTMIASLPSDIPTLAEVLDDNGSTVKTGFFGKWHLGESSGMLPTDRGWDYFAGAIGGEIDYYDWQRTLVTTSGGAATTSTQTDYGPSVNVTDALSWIKSQKGQWWATVALNAAHTQENTPPTYPEPPLTCLSGTITGTDDTSLFHKTIECADYLIGTLIKGISSDTLAKTTIIFVGDNGTAGAVSQVYSSARSKGSAYQGGVHVPLIIADGAAIVSRTSMGTGKITSPGRTVSNIASTVDIFSTIADILGTTPTSPTDSTSLLTYLNSASASAARSYVYTDTFSYRAADVAALSTTPTLAQVSALTPSTLKGAARGPKFKVVYTGTKYEMYDLATDPFEQSNIACTTLTVVQTAAKAALVAEMQRVDSNYPAASCP